MPRTWNAPRPSRKRLRLPGGESERSRGIPSFLGGLADGRAPAHAERRHLAGAGGHLGRAPRRRDAAAARALGALLRPLHPGGHELRERLLRFQARRRRQPDRSDSRGAERPGAARDGEDGGLHRLRHLRCAGPLAQPRWPAGPSSPSASLRWRRAGSTPADRGRSATTGSATSSSSSSSGWWRPAAPLMRRRSTCPRRHGSQGRRWGRSPRPSWWSTTSATARPTRTWARTRWR